MSSIPKPMPDPCRRCPKANGCASSDNYKCPLFRAVFIRSWDETVTFLRAMLTKKEERP